MSLDYNEGHIRELSTVEGIRMRPAMYIDGVGQLGLFKIDMEAIQNILDEFTAGRCRKCIITHNTSDGYMKVEDDAGGMPIGKIKAIFTKMHAGGKFDNKAYKYHSGQNGAGLKCLNALSKKLIVEVWQVGYTTQDGTVVPNRHAKLVFEKGILISEDYDTDNVEGRHGTTMEYWVDESILQTHERNLNRFRSTLEMLMYINPGFDIILTVDGKTTRYYNTEYLPGYLQHFTKTHKIKTLIDPQMVESYSDENGIDIKAIFTYSPQDKGDSGILSFVNGNNTVAHGTHVSGFRAGLASALTNYISRNNQIIPKNLSNLKITGATLSDNVIGIVILMHPDALFNGQTKEKLTSTDAENYSKQIAYNFFTTYLNNNTQSAQKLITLAINKAKLAAETKKLRENFTAINKDTKNNFSNTGINPKKYATCKSNDSSIKELFICEGDSAGGTVKAARDVGYQAVYMLRGKLINVYNTKNQSQETLDLIKILGMGHPDKKNYKNLNYNKIILMCDADDDGGHIVTLVLSFFYKYYPELIEHGHLYVAKPPIMTVKTNKSKFFITRKEDYDIIMENLTVNTFDLKSLGKGNKTLSEGLFRVFIKKTLGYPELIDSLSIPLCIDSDLLELITIHMNDLMNENYEVFNKYGYQVGKRIINNVNTFEFDLGYKHMFVSIDEDFIKNVYEPLLKKLCDIHLQGVYLEGKKSGQTYQGTIYKLCKVMSNILGNDVQITRNKGLGEMQWNELQETAVDPATRNVVKITLKDTEKALKSAGVFMGSLDPDLKKASFAGEDIFDE